MEQNKLNTEDRQALLKQLMELLGEIETPTAIEMLVAELEKSRSIIINLMEQNQILQTQLFSLQNPPNPLK